MLFVATFHAEYIHDLKEKMNCKKMAIESLVNQEKLKDGPEKAIEKKIEARQNKIRDHFSQDRKDLDKAKVSLNDILYTLERANISVLGQILSVWFFQLLFCIIILVDVYTKG